MASRNDPDSFGEAAEAAGGYNIPVFTVSEIAQALRTTIERGFPRVRVRGEITGFKRHTSGHLYFRLKDESAVLEAVCWRNAAPKLGVVPEDGLEVIATGRLTTYAGRSQYQIVVEALEIAGEGALLKLLEERRKKLLAEGLFAAERKQPIPYLPEIVGVVTSPTGAVIRDILHRIAERFPRRVLLWPVAVQGAGAAEQIAAAIAGFNRLPPGGPVPRPDVLIVARGGGSLEDLWAFNEEIVVRAAAESQIPLISAVGHETDTTLIDFAADRRAPTPTAAAEMAVPVRTELAHRLTALEARLIGAAHRSLERQRAELRGLARGLPDPAALLGQAAQRLDEKSTRLQQGMRFLVEARRTRLHRLHLRHPRELLRERKATLRGAARALKAALEARLRAERDRGKHDTTRLRHLERRLGSALDRALGLARRDLSTRAKLLESYSYQRVLERGFVLVRDARGQTILRAGATRPGMPLSLNFADGRVPARVTGRSEGARPLVLKKPTPAQGTLL